MFARVIAPIFILLLAVTTAQAGVIVNAEDSPSIPASSFQTGNGSQDQSPEFPVIDGEQSGQMRAMEFDRPAPSVSAISIGPEDYAFFLNVSDKLIAMDSKLPIPPELDGLIKPPQKIKQLSFVEFCLFV